MSNLCAICPRKCNANRSNDIGYGYCKMPEKPMLAKAGLHYGEEPCISGESGSGTVFFSGCSLKCVFCQNKDISQNGKGKIISIKRLAEIFKELEFLGAENINLVTPTHYSKAIIEALDIYRPKIPIVYNTSGYEDVDALDMLKDYIDVYLVDYKFFDNSRANKYSKSLDYNYIVQKALLKISSNLNYKCEYNSSGIMTKGLIIRHMIMPLGTNDSLRIIDWCKNNIPFAVFSLMSQYTPIEEFKNFPELNRKITKREYEKVISKISIKDFSEIYIQELSSATIDFIPNFDFSGI